MRRSRLAAPLLYLSSLFGLSATGLSAQDAAVDFNKQVKPILESACVNCHNAEKQKGDVALHTLEATLAGEGEEYGAVLVPGEPEKSGLFTTVLLPEDDDYVMPPKGGTLSKAQADVLKHWIAAGAKWPAGVVLEQAPRIDFVKHVQPMLEENCISCHGADEDKGDLRLHTAEVTFGGEDPSIIPFDPENSLSLTLCLLDEDDDDLMPPKKSGGPLSEEQLEQFTLWISQGAVWPEGVVLEAKEKKSNPTNTPDTMDLVQKIHATIVATSLEKAEADMKAYAAQIPKTGVGFEMLAIPGGEFLLGSPEGEADRQPDEGPQVKVKISPFWMGKTEVTWDEYNPFMVTAVGRNKDGSLTDWAPEDPVDNLVSQPTTPYVEMSFGMGTDGYPAISMTQHAANKYCQWLSAQTGHFYRLPTEAEWEYACRAGTTTAYSFGDDVSKLDDYAWHYENSEYQYQPVGQKKPNPWGLHDMHGNVIEWCLDQYSEKDYETMAAAGTPVDPWRKATTLYPRVARGGSWDDDPDALRSAARRKSSDGWKQTDPQLPQSIWYHTDTLWLGFRIVRPLAVPTPEEMYDAWFRGVIED